jgi:hypothetical protein
MKEHSLCTVDGGVISGRDEIHAGSPEAASIFYAEFLEIAVAGVRSRKAINAIAQANVRVRCSGGHRDSSASCQRVALGGHAATSATGAHGMRRLENPSRGLSRRSATQNWKTGIFSVGAGGEGGIRTPDTLASMPHFECGAFNRSATSPTR